MDLCVCVCARARPASLGTIHLGAGGNRGPATGPTYPFLEPLDSEANTCNFGLVFAFSKAKSRDRRGRFRVTQQAEAKAGSETSVPGMDGTGPPVRFWGLKLLAQPATSPRLTSPWPPHLGNSSW